MAIMLARRSPLGVYQRSPLGVRGPGVTGIAIAAALGGFGGITAHLGVVHGPVTVDEWQRQYTVSGGVYVFSADVRTPRNSAIGCGARGTATAANVNRGTFQYTSVAADVGKLIAFHASLTANTGTPNPIDVFFASSAIATAFIMAGGSLIGTIPATGSQVVNYSTGFTFTSIGQTVTFYWVMQGDTGSMIASVGTFTNAHNFNNFGYVMY